MSSKRSFEGGRPKALQPGTTQLVRSKLRAVANPVPGRPDRVVVLLSASRSGSTTVHDLLSRCPGVVALAGEVEPYLRLTGNAQGADGSNKVDTPRDLKTLRMIVRSDLREWSKPSEPSPTYRYRKELLQWPEGTGNQDQGWYDGSSSAPQEDISLLEEPPLVPVVGAERPSSLDNKTVILKTPQLVYRRSVISRIFPGVPIVYVWLQRSCAGTVNGLLDGWSGPHFWSYNLPAPRGASLPDWWCFDVPPCWERVQSLRGACELQWQQANLFAEKYPYEHVLKYESLWSGGAQRLASDLGLNPAGLETKTLMATSAPKMNRWVDTRPQLVRLTSSPVNRLMMEKMGYNLNKAGKEW